MQLDDIRMHLQLDESLHHDGWAEFDRLNLIFVYRTIEDSVIFTA